MILVERGHPADRSHVQQVHLMADLGGNGQAQSAANAAIGVFEHTLSHLAQEQAAVQQATDYADSATVRFPSMWHQSSTVLFVQQMRAGLPRQSAADGLAEVVPLPPFVMQDKWPRRVPGCSSPALRAKGDGA